MEVIGPQRLHHSPFVSRQMLAPFHQQSSMAAASTTTAGGGSSSTSTRGAGRSQASGRGAGKRREGTTCPPRFERAREDRSKRQADGKGASESTGKQGAWSDSSSSTSASVGSTSSAPTGKGRESRNSTSSTESRRQPSAKQQNQRRWSKNVVTSGNHSNGSGPNSPRSSTSSTGGNRTSRRRKQLHTDRLSASEEIQKQQQQQQTTEVGDSKPKTTKTEGRNRKRKQSGRRSRGTRPMSSIDSGKGEDLSSSCESSVFDPQHPSTLVESRGPQSRCSSCSSMDEFHDALSHPASDDDGVNSSAFVTPSSTRPHSPTTAGACLLSEHLVQKQSSVLSNESTIDELCSSLKQLGSDRQQYGALWESHDSHVVQSVDCHMTSSESHTTSSESHMTSADGCTTAPHDSHVIESANGHMTSTEGHVTCAESHMTPPEILLQQVVATTSHKVPPMTEGTEDLTIHHQHDSRVPPICECEPTLHSEVSTTAGVNTGDCKGETEVVDVCGSGTDSAPASPTKPSLQPHNVSTPQSSLTASVGHESTQPSSCSVSNASPQSSSDPTCTPLTSSATSQSPAPSSPPSQLSPSPSPKHIVGDRVAMDTVARLPMTAREPYETDQAISNHTDDDQTVPQEEEDEWPDLHGPVTTEVKVHPQEAHPPHHDIIETDSAPSVIKSPYSLYTNEGGREDVPPLYTSSDTNAEVRVHPFEPHLLNAAAAYPHHTHILPPYPMPWQWITGPLPTTTLGYNYYGVPYLPPGSFYAGGPQVVWSRFHGGPHVDLPPPPPPFSGPQYGVVYNNINEDSSVKSDKTPPTSVVEMDARSSEDEVESSVGQEEGEEREGKDGEVEEREGEEREKEEGEEEEKEDERWVGECASGDGGEVSDVVLEVGGDCCEDVIIPAHHPLESTWVMWYDKITGTTRNRSCDYRLSLQQLHTMSSVEDFWSLYNNIHQPSCLDRNSNYHFFKKGIDPLWEDPANEPGGKWVLTVRDECLLDTVWEEMLLAMIGGVIHSCHAVNGAVVSRRKKGDKVALWTSKKSTKINLDICADIVRVLAIACGVSGDNLSGFIHQLAEGRDGLSLVYMYHTDSMKTGTSYQNNAHIHLRDNSESLVAKVLKRLT